MDIDNRVPDSNPRHIAIIMDGNGRWAKARGLPRVAGHQAGYETLRGIITACHQRGIEVLSLFAFSSENWRRPPLEVNALMALLGKGLREEVQALHQQNIRIRFIGDLTQLHQKLQTLIYHATELTAANTGMTLVFAINYGGQWDIIQAVKSVATKVATGNLSVHDIDQDQVQQAMCLAECPPLDLLIRTSGERRVSNFFLWQLVYAELYFTDIFWPDFVEAELNKALEYFTNRNRRFGYTDEQLRQANHA